MAEEKEFLTYKGRPLVRNGNTLYYGDMSEEFVIMIQIVSTKKRGRFRNGRQSFGAASQHRQ